MFLGQYYEIFDWFIIYFTENNGMAFGLELGGELGKLILTLTRIFIVVFLCSSKGDSGDIEFSSEVSRLICCLADLFASKNLFKRAGSVSFEANDDAVSGVSATNGAETNRK